MLPNDKEAVGTHKPIRADVVKIPLKMEKGSLVGRPTIKYQSHVIGIRDHWTDPLTLLLTAHHLLEVKAKGQDEDEGSMGWESLGKLRSVAGPLVVDGLRCWQSWLLLML